MLYSDGTDFRKECDVNSGSWVLIKRLVPVDKSIRPQIYGIYWAIPHVDRFNRQMCKIYTPQEVCLLNHEYTVISSERLEDYKKAGYFLKENCVEFTEPLNIKLIEEGRSLCEEKREIIYALQLDGLTEQQACEEYFLSHHTDAQNINVCYLPTSEILEELVSCFGEC